MESDNIFWCETRDTEIGRKCFHAWEHISHNNSDSKWNNIPSLFQPNKLHCQYCFVTFHQRQWNLLNRVWFFFFSFCCFLLLFFLLQEGIEADLMQHNCIERIAISCIMTLFDFLNRGLSPGGNSGCGLCARWATVTCWFYCLHKAN